MGEVFFSFGEIVVNGSRCTRVSDDDHDILKAIFENTAYF